MPAVVPGATVMVPSRFIVMLPEASAMLQLTPEFRYLGKADARRVLEQYWGNPEDDSVMGLLVPTADGLDSEHSWAVVLTWSPDGYVSDEDAAEIDYADLLEQMQDETRDSNEYLAEAGYPTVELVAYRVVQESLANVLQHARATELCIEAVALEAGARLRIVDNGVGFDPAQPHRRGLLAMQERARAIGAELRLLSEPGQTVVEIVVK